MKKINNSNNDNNVTFNNIMSIAIKEAKKAFKKNIIPIGCVITDDNNNIIAKSSNSKQNNSCILHAEIHLILHTCKKLKQNSLRNCNMYVTLEPCTMCCAAIALAKIKRLYISVESAKTGGLKFFNSKQCNHKPDIYKNIMPEESSKLLIKFFKNKRKN